MPLFSIIVPTKNRPQYLKRAIESILAQTIQDYEIIIVDDSSAAKYVQEYEKDIQAYQLKNKNIKFLRSATSQGPAAARNRGLAVSSGDFISFLDDDDEYLPQFLEKSLDILKDTSDDIGFCWTSVNHIYAKNNLSKLTRIFKHSSNRNNLLLLTKIGIGHGFTFKKKCMAQLNGFDTYFKTVEDTEFFFRLINNNFLPKIISEPLINIHHHNLPRLTSIAMHLTRIVECRILIKKYQTIFNQYKKIKFKFLSHFNRLKKQYFKMNNQNILIHENSSYNF